MPHQQCNIIEKWPKFSGDNNLVPVTDFLRQIDILCRSYGISKSELRMHAHLLFKEGAYAWYTTYEEKFYSWEVLESYLKLRYDNPNRDRMIKEEMRNRKQRPNELFSAYLTDMEMYASRMNRKMSDYDKYEMIVENMKMSYKRRLALEQIMSIEHLAQMCFRLDAVEPHLYHSGNSRPGINQVDIDKCYLNDFTGEDEEVYMLQNSVPKPYPRNDNREPPRWSNQNSTARQCWNCGNADHVWRDCKEAKRRFCHVCGFMDTVANNCPNRHNLAGSNTVQKNA